MKKYKLINTKYEQITLRYTPHTKAMEDKITQLSCTTATSRRR